MVIQIKTLMTTFLDKSDIVNAKKDVFYVQIKKKFQC